MLFRSRQPARIRQAHRLKHATALFIDPHPVDEALRDASHSGPELAHLASAYARSPRALAAGAEMARAGFPLEDVLDIIDHARGHFQAVSDRIVGMVVRELDKFGEGQLPPPSEVPRIVDVLWRIRPLALVALETEMMRSLEISANKYLGDRVAAILEHLNDKPAS